MRGDKLFREDIFHIAGKEKRVFDSVDATVFFGIFYGFGYVLDSHHFFRASRHEIGNGSRAGIEVVNQLAAR